MPSTCRFGIGNMLATFTLILFWLVVSLPVAASWAFVPAEGSGGLIGAARAKGVIVWSHGRSLDAEDSLTPAPGFVLEMRKADWDVLRFNRLRRDDTLSESSAVLAQAAGELKASGYAHVVLAGHSFGGLLSLIAATRSDATDAVIATAPAAWGNRIDNPDVYQLNATRLFDPVVAAIRRHVFAAEKVHGERHNRAYQERRWPTTRTGESLLCQRSVG